jgi:hypothetical protein
MVPDRLHTFGLGSTVSLWRKFYDFLRGFEIHSRLKFQLDELEDELKKSKKQNEELTSQCAEYKTSVDSKVSDES